MAGQRAINFEPLKIRPGIFTMTTPTEAIDRWRDGINARWDSPVPQKMGGYLQNPIYDENGVDITYQGRARAYHEWESLDGQSWIAFGTACRLYLINNSTLYDITPQRRQAYISNGVATTNLSPIVTITDPAHGAQDGDHITIEGGSAVGGLTLGGAYDIVTVLDADSYTILASANATSTATGGGSMTIRYDISCGLESDGFLYGYGVGDYGEGTYGTARSTSTFRGFARIWSLDNWGEDLIASPNGDTLYVWKRQNGPQSKAEFLTGAPANVERMIIGPDNLHILAIGANLASTGVQDKMFVRWCVGGDYNDWVITDTNDAGSKRLDLGSRLITAVKTNRAILIWSDKALYLVSFIGGLDVYDITLIATSPQIMSPNAAVDVNGTVYAMCEDDFYIYDGTYRILECDMKNVVFGDGENVGINNAERSKVTCRVRSAFNEIWWSYPQGDSTENSVSVIYNYDLKCWYPSSIAREVGGDKVPAYDYPVGLFEGKMWLEENGVDAGEGEALEAFLETYEQQLAEGSFKAEICELVPNFSRFAGSMDVSLFGRNYPSENRTAGPVRTIDPNTVHINPRFKKRQIAIRFETTAVGDDWRMDTWRGKYIPHGR